MLFTNCYSANGTKSSIVHITENKQQTDTLLTDTINKKPNNNTIEKFDITQYESLQIDSATTVSDSKRNFIDGDKRISIGVVASDMGYNIHKGDIVVTEENNTPFRISKRYYEKTKLLAIEQTKFYDMPVGFRREYDENGNLIKETNYDEHFHFGIHQLAKKMKDEYDIDIMNSRKVLRIERVNVAENNSFERVYPYIASILTDKNRYLYILVLCRQYINRIYDGATFIDGLDFDLYCVDGNTGKTLYKEQYYVLED
jgi:hypothetical protein